MEYANSACAVVCVWEEVKTIFHAGMSIMKWKGWKGDRERMSDREQHREREGGGDRNKTRSAKRVIVKHFSIYYINCAEGAFGISTIKLLSPSWSREMACPFIALNKSILYVLVRLCQAHKPHRSGGEKNFSPCRVFADIVVIVTVLLLSVH